MPANLTEWLIFAACVVISTYMLHIGLNTF